MKKIFVLIFSFLVLLFLLPAPALADEGWVIEKFSSQINIEKTGKVRVSETINVDFGDLTKHGIFRDIPYIYDDNGSQIYTQVDIEKVLQNEQPAKFAVSKSGAYLQLKIGDADRTITGKNAYTIQYQVTGVLKSFPDYDELYWNATGNNWPVPITSAQAQINLPQDGVLQTKCFEGYTGATDPCLITDQKAASASFITSKILSTNEGLTIVVGYQKGMVPVLSVERPLSFWEKFTAWPSLYTIFTALLFGIGTVVYLWYKYGRDYWFAANLFGTKKEQGVIKPIIAHETIVVEYTPPEKLRPAEIGVVADEIAHTNDITATIIDLASRGFLSVVEIPKGWLFGKTDYELRKKEKNVKELLNYEKKLLDKLFHNRTKVKISDLKTTFYEELKEIKQELYIDVVGKKLFPQDPDKVRSKYLLIAILTIMAAVFIGFFSVSWDNIFIADLSLGALVSGIILLGVSRFMPRRTAYGREIYRRINGYKLFISKAETYRQRFFENKNLFNEVLPYAIIFGLTGKFSQAMKDIGLQTTSPGWYTGVHPFNTSVFASDMNDFSNSLGSAIASAPQSSGFSGGGASGGGFGGGGGGSW